MAWEVYVDPNGDAEKRQHVESCPTNPQASEISAYLRPRLPKGDVVSAQYGQIIAPGGKFDYSRLRESENVPALTWDAFAERWCA